MGGMMNGFGGFGTYGLIGMILNLVITVGLIVGVVLLVVWLVRRVSQEQSTQASTGRLEVGVTPREVVQLRYARGEITREQYQEILADLGEI